MRGVTFDKLRALLGKTVDDPAVSAAFKQAGKVSVTRDHIVAKDAGFDFSLERPKSGRGKKQLSALFLYADGVDKHRGFSDLPAGFAFAPRAALLAAMPPARTFKIGKGDVPVSTPDAEVAHDTWRVDGLSICALYGSNRGAETFIVTVEDDEGADLSTNPLHFEAKPADAPEHAELVGMALLVAWAAQRFGLPKKHAGSELGKRLLARAITPVAFLKGACGKALSAHDFDPQLGNFLWGYVNRTFSGDEYAARATAGKAIAKLLRLQRSDERSYNDDFLGTFKGAVKSPFYVPDSWDAFERIAPVLDARWADYQATELSKVPDLALYERAAEQRDAHSLAAYKQAAPTISADAELTAALVGLIGRSLTDKAVKGVLERAGIPVGKKVDKQANPALGVSYMGSNYAIGGKRKLSVTEVTFYAKGQKDYVRGMHTKFKFDAYKGPLPHDLAFGQARAAVVKALRAKLGPPDKQGDDFDLWRLPQKQRVICSYNRNEKLVELSLGLSL